MGADSPKCCTQWSQVGIETSWSCPLSGGSPGQGEGLWQQPVSPARGLIGENQAQVKVGGLGTQGGLCRRGGRGGEPHLDLGTN